MAEAVSSLCMRSCMLKVSWALISVQEIARKRERIMDFFDMILGNKPRIGFKIWDKKKAAKWQPYH